MKLDPRFVPFQIDLGKSYLQDNRVDAAVAHLQQARPLDPKEKAAFSQLAIAYRKKGEQPLAARMLRILSQINEDEMRNFHRERFYVVKDELPNETAQSVQ